MPFFSPAYNRIHEQKRQKERQLRALVVTVNSLDTDRKTGDINGYCVSLDHCECMDFRKRKKPCKHIYRLAMELGIFPVPFGHTLSECQNAEWAETPQPPISKESIPISSCATAVTQSEVEIPKRRTSKWLWLVLFTISLLLCAVLFGSQSSRTKPTPSKSPSVHTYHYDIKPHSQALQPRIHNETARKATDKTSQAIYNRNHPEQESSQDAYIGNRNSHIFHYPSCRAVRKMNPSNMVDFESRENATIASYRPCRICYP